MLYPDFSLAQGIALGCFLAAIIHAFLVEKFLLRADALSSKEGGSTARQSFWDFAGHLTFAFSIWLVPAFILIAYEGGLEGVAKTLYSADLVEPSVTLTFMFLALSATMRDFFRALVSRVASIFGGSPRAWWVTCLILGVLLDGLISEAAAIVLVALAMADQFYAGRPSARFCYVTFAVLISVMALGNLLLPLNITASMDLSSHWGWSHWIIAEQLSWRVLCTILCIISTGVFWITSDLKSLSTSTKDLPTLRMSPALLGYALAFIVCSLLKEVAVLLIVIVALVCVLEGEVKSRRHTQRLMLPLLIALFNYSMELHAYFLSGTVGAIYASLSEGMLPIMTVLFSGLNEHIPGLHFIESYSGLSAEAKERGLLAFSIGGGLAVFSSSMNMVSYKLLKAYFPGGVISTRKLLAYSVPIAVLAYLVLELSYFLPI